MCLLLPLSASPYPVEQVKAILQAKYPIHFVHFWFLKRHLNWKFKTFVCFVCVCVFFFFFFFQSYAPLPFNAFVAKFIHGYLKAISQNPIKAKNQFCILI